MDSKKQALAQFLEVKPELISNDYSHYYEVNKRIVKRGKTPEQIKQTAGDLRSLFDLGIQGLISSGITSTNADLRKEIYMEAREALAPIAERAKKWQDKKDKLRMTTPLGVSPSEVAKHKVEENYLKLQKDNMYVENILYHLLAADDTDYNVSLRKAWVGEPVDDLRKDETVNDGEYLVLTDSEADDWEEEGLRNLFEEFTREVPDFINRLVDEDQYIQEYSGNRGENISGYDGTEYSVHFGGEEFFIYRNN